MKFTEFDHRRALLFYATDRSVANTARYIGTSRQSVQMWKKQGWPVAMTNGVDWDTFLDAEEAKQIGKMTSKKAALIEQDTVEFLKDAKEDVRMLFDAARDRLLQGGGKLSYGDIEKLLMMYIRLDNQASDRVIWMQDVMRKIIRIVMGRVKDERIILQIQNDMIGLAAEEQRKLGPIPGQEELPEPADIIRQDRIIPEALSAE